VSNSSSVRKQRTSLIGAIRLLYKQRQAMLIIVKRDIAQEFIQTSLGPIWFIIQPFMQSVVFYVVFGNVGNMPTEGQSAFFFYMFGLLVWNSYSQASINVGYTLVENRGILTKVPCSPLLFPLCRVLFRSLQCGVNLTVFYAAYIVIHGLGAINITLFNFWMIPFGVLVTMFTALSGGLIAAALSTKKRDFLYMWSYVITALMYLSPIIYPFSVLSPKWQLLAGFNPLTIGIESVRGVLIGAPPLDAQYYGSGLLSLAILFLISLAFFVKRFQNAMDTI